MPGSLIRWVALRDGRWEGPLYLPDGASGPRVELALSDRADGRMGTLLFEASETNESWIKKPWKD